MRLLKVFKLLLTVITGAGAIVGAVAPRAADAATAARSQAAAPGSAAASHPSLPPNFGNLLGDFPVPLAASAVETLDPTHVIGNGTPASCTSAAVVTAVAEGGIITFSCGPLPVTIVMTATANVAKTEQSVVLDGGGLVTLSGGGKSRILFSDTCAGKWSTGDCVSQPYPQITVQNITFEDGYDGTHQATCTANEAQCWYGGVNGGGAIYAEGGQFKAVNARFLSNKCYGYGPDLGGGAIRVLAQYRNDPVYITSDTFTGNSCSNGGALSSIGVQWDIYNSIFTGNSATGWGANPAAKGTSGGGSGGAIYNDGDSYSTVINGTVMNGNTAREGGGAVFYVVDAGSGGLSFNLSGLNGNASGEFQNAPGIFDHIDGSDVTPPMFLSADN